MARPKGGLEALRYDLNKARVRRKYSYPVRILRWVVYVLMTCNTPDVF